MSRESDLLTGARVLGELTAQSRRLAAGLERVRAAGPVTVGASAREPVAHLGRAVLHRFRPLTDDRQRVPVLIVYALANRHYMTDLQEDRSLVRGLLLRGLDVYLIDWGYPEPEDRQLTLEHYARICVDHFVDHIRARHGLGSVNLLGICQGGTFSVCYAALHPEKVRNLVTMVTPVDFHTPDDLLSRWVRHVDVDLMVDSLGNVPGDLLNWVFMSLKPLQLMGKKYVDMLDRMDDGEALATFLRMERWIEDSPAQAGECFRQFVKDCYQGNKLVAGELRVGGRRVDPGRITMPVLNVFARDDHIVPPAASQALEGIVGSADYTGVQFAGGHIGIYVSRSAQRQVPPAIADWLERRSGAGAPEGVSPSARPPATPG
jgi:polyhydroxyalkanoate synthase